MFIRNAYPGCCAQQHRPRKFPDTFNRFRFAKLNVITWAKPFDHARLKSLNVKI